MIAAFKVPERKEYIEREAAIAVIEERARLRRHVHDMISYTYLELVKRLRNCATQAAPCKTCDMTEDGSCSDTLMKQAADAIEELQKAVLRLEEASGILDELPMVDQREPPKEE